MTFESCDNSGSIFGSSRSDDTLYNVIYHQSPSHSEIKGELTSKRIISESDNIGVHLLEEVPSLIGRKTFESLLQHSTSVWVGGELQDVGGE
jgi:hypothetical protein